MRRTTALLVALAFTLPLVGCGRSGAPVDALPSSTAAPVLVESSPPTSGDTEPDDFRKDITNIRVGRASAKNFPEGDTVTLSATFTNHGTAPATYQVTFGIYDAALTQVGAFATDTGVYDGPTKAGGRLDYAAEALELSTGHLPTGAFTVEVQSISRVTEPTD